MFAFAPFPRWHEENLRHKTLTDTAGAPVTGTVPRWNAPQVGTLLPRITYPHQAAWSGTLSILEADHIEKWEDYENEIKNLSLKLNNLQDKLIHDNVIWTYLKNEFRIPKKIKKVKVKWSCYRPSVAQRVGRGIALLFHDCVTRRGWMVSSTPRPHFTPGKDPVPILQEAGWAPGPVWTGGKCRPHRDSIPDRPARSQSLYRLSYPAHTKEGYKHETKEKMPNRKANLNMGTKE